MLSTPFSPSRNVLQPGDEQLIDDSQNDGTQEEADDALHHHPADGSEQYDQHRGIDASPQE